MLNLKFIFKTRFVVYGLVGLLCLGIVGVGLFLAPAFLKYPDSPAPIISSHPTAQSFPSSAPGQLSSPVVNENDASLSQNTPNLNSMPPELLESFTRVTQREVSGAYLPVAIAGQEGVYRLDNPAQEFATELSSRGVKINEWSMKLNSYNYTGQTDQLLSWVQPVLTENRIEYYYGNGLVEWYVNSELGLEQGFTLAHPLNSSDVGSAAGNSGLELNIGLDGTTASEDGSGWIRLGTGQRYGGLVAWDGQHRTLSSHLTVVGSNLKLQIDLQGAVYPITVDPFVLQQKLLPDDSEANAHFGVSAALSEDGSTALVGASGKSNYQGAAYVFTLSANNSWQLQQKLTISDAITYTYFGTSVALSADGNTALIGADANFNDFRTGAAYVFNRSNTTWSQTQKLTGDDTELNDFFGASVALTADGNTALVGAYAKNRFMGAAYVFNLDSSSGIWSQVQKLLDRFASYTGYFGYSVAFSADGITALISAYGKYDFQGAAYVFIRNNGDSSWSQQQELTSSDVVFNGAFGASVALSADGNTALIGSGYRNTSTQRGAYVFTRSGVTWSQQQKLVPNDTGGNFGYSVALGADGNTALVGAHGRNAVYVFTRSGESWSQQQKLTASDPASRGEFGISVALNSTSNIALIGGDAYGRLLQGNAYFFTRNDTTWSQQQNIFLNDATNNDFLGNSVALSADGNTALIGAYGKNNAQGAAYIFIYSASSNSWTFQQKLTASEAPDNGFFGASVALGGDGYTALVGAYGRNTALGAAYIFTRSGLYCTLQQKITPDDSANGDYFGASVALSKDSSTALVGAYGINLNQGAAYVFTSSSGSWTQQQKMTAGNPTNNSFFGASVALKEDGSGALIGAYGDNNNQGAVYSFTRSGATWGQEQKLTAGDPADGDNFGYRVALSTDGNTALAGALFKNNGNGAAYVFTRSGGSGASWSQQQKLTASDSANGDNFGISVTINRDGTTAVIGAANKQNLQGVVYVFTRRSSVANWDEMQKLNAVYVTNGDQFGYSVALSSDVNMLIVGAPFNNNIQGAAYGFNFSKTAPQISLTSSANPSQTGQPVTFTATVTTPSLLIAASSSVTFTIDNLFAANVNLDGNNQAVFATSSLPSGQHTVQVLYSGDRNYNQGYPPSLTQVVKGQPAAISAVSGTPQIATYNTPFGAPLVAKVTDESNNPVSSVIITFTAPASGASGTFAGGSTVYTGTTDTNGTVASTTFTANATPGSYTVKATVSGVATPASFSLTNTSVAATITAVSGTPQSTTVNRAFPSTLVARVTDSGNYPVSSVVVTLTAPASGASGTFVSGSAVYTGTTDASGTVTSTTFTANSSSGSYSVTAAVAGVGIPASFSLTNFAGCDPLVVTSSADTETCGTLRNAINQANSQITSGPVTITLSTSVITVTGALPALINTGTNTLTVNGACTTGVNGRGIPGTRITTGAVFNSPGLTLSNHVIINGVAVTNSQGFGIDIIGDYNAVSCSWIGTADGTIAASNGGGISISGSNNSLGTAENVASGNLISGNTGLGVQVGTGTGNTAYANLIGWQVNGETAMINGGGGLKVVSGSQLIMSTGNRVKA